MRLVGEKAPGAVDRHTVASAGVDRAWRRLRAGSRSDAGGGVAGDSAAVAQSGHSWRRRRDRASGLCSVDQQLRRRTHRIPECHRERVVERCRPKRPPRRGARNSDALDAVRAAREVRASDHLITPRSRGHREALRVLMTTEAGAVAARTAAINHLKALIVSAPEDLRAELRGRTSDLQIAYRAKLRDRPARDVDHRTTMCALRCRLMIRISCRPPGWCR